MDLIYTSKGMENSDTHPRNWTNIYEENQCVLGKGHKGKNILLNCLGGYQKPLPRIRESAFKFNLLMDKKTE